MTTPKACWIRPVYLFAPRKRPISFCPPYANANKGIPTPVTYATVTKTTDRETCPVAASTATVAKIGPAQGDQTMPSEKPVINPGKNPEPCLHFVQRRLKVLRH